MIFGAVSLMHLGVIWAVQAEMGHAPTEITEPDAVLTQLVDLPQPPTSPKTTEHETPETPPVQSPTTPQRPAPPIAPTDVAPMLTASTPAPATISTNTAAAAAIPPSSTGGSAAAPSVSPPSQDADYALACHVAYPPLSRSLHEHGRVTLKILVGGDGRSRRVDLVRSSGSSRLDQAAEEAMRRCHFKPGTVDGVAQEMAYEAPVDFVLR